MSETPETAPPFREAPIRQSGQETIFGFTGWRVGPIMADYGLKDLRLYEPRWVWPPSFKHTRYYPQMLRSIKESGIFHPLLILSDGRVVDGRHRYSCAKELDLQSVPARVIDVALPLSDADQLAIEDWAVYDAIARRQLTKAQATEMLYDLLRGRTEVQAKLARLANLKRGREKADIHSDPSHTTVKELAARAGKSQRSVERAVTVVRHAPPEIQAQLRSGRLTLGGAERAMKVARAAGNGTGEATAALAETREQKPADAVVTHTNVLPSGTRAAATASARPATAPTAPTPAADGPFQSAHVAEMFVDSARALVRKARTWNREALEQLSHALGQIETSLRDGGARGRDEHRDD